jgi:hypothetical protein
MLWPWLPATHPWTFLVQLDPSPTHSCLNNLSSPLLVQEAWDPTPLQELDKPSEFNRNSTLWEPRARCQWTEHLLQWLVQTPTCLLSLSVVTWEDQWPKITWTRLLDGAPELRPRSQELPLLLWWPLIRSHSNLKEERHRLLMLPMINTSSMLLRKRVLTFHTHVELELAAPALVKLLPEPSTKPTRASWMRIRWKRDSFLPVWPIQPLTVPSRLTRKMTFSED